jgi:hypothetical protein
MNKDLKIAIFMLGVSAMLAVSCGKEITTSLEKVPATANMNADTKREAATTTAPYLFDAPSGTDVTVALQAALTANKTVQINKTYLISDALTIPSGGTLTSGGIKNAVLKASNTRSGLLGSRAIYINISGKNAVSVLGIKFQPALNMTEQSAYANTVILLSNSSNCTIADNTFDFNFLYAKGMSAIWITGPLAVSNKASGNVIKTLGITYCENGASYNIVQNNQLINASSNALGGIGNGTSPCTNNQVLNNTITNAGRMGIEDQQNTVGTIISGNTIIGAGKMPGIALGLGMGISAVAKNTVVKQNKITDVKDYYIEVGGNNNVSVLKNEIYDSGKYSGIFVNFTAKVANDLSKQTSIKGNSVTGCSAGIETFGLATTQYITIDSNQVIDPVARAINIDAGNSVKSSILINNNTIRYNKPTNASRYGIVTYTRTSSSKQDYTFKVNGNLITYALNAGLGTGYDISMIIGFDNTAVTYNTINGYAGGRNVGVTNNGAITNGVNFIGNTVKLATWNTASFLNAIVKAKAEITNDKLVVINNRLW